MATKGSTVKHNRYKAAKSYLGRLTRAGVSHTLRRINRSDKWRNSLSQLQSSQTFQALPTNHEVVSTSHPEWQPTKSISAPSFKESSACGSESGK